MILQLVNELSKYVFIPFTLKNSSYVPDENITLDLYIDENTVIDVKSETFFENSELAKIGGILHDEDAINGIFYLPQNMRIAYGDYYPSTPIAQGPHIEIVGEMLNNSYESTDGDFIDDLNDHIAEPEGNHYALQLHFIRSSEMVWLEKGLLLKSLDHINKARIQYKVTSNMLSDSIDGKYRI